LNEREKAAEYGNDFRGTNFGYMGRKDVLYFYEKRGFGSTDTLQVNNGFVVARSLDPRVEGMKSYYAKTKKPYKDVALVQKHRVKQLGNDLWNKRKVSTGEDIGRLTWYKQNIEYDFDARDNPSGWTEGNEVKKTLRKGDKLEKHQKALQETQLVKVKNKETLEGKVDIQKAKEVRRAIRRRYGNRTNFHKIFNQWDRKRKGYIDIADLHYMVNRMGINVNVQEAQVLLASHDYNGHQRLYMDEFMNLIFSTDDNMNVDLSKIPYRSSIEEMELTDDFVAEITKDAKKLRKAKEKNQMKFVLQNTLGSLRKDFREQDKGRSREVDFMGFKKILLNQASLPGYMKENSEIIKELFDEFDTNKTGKVNYPEMLQGLFNFRYTEENDINYDLGPETEYNYVSLRGARTSVKTAPALTILDVQKIPENKMELVIDRTLKVARQLQSKYKSQAAFDKELKQNVKADSYGNVSVEALEKYFIEICKEELAKHLLSRRDLEGFLSSFVYNRYKMTNINDITPQVFRDNNSIITNIYTVQRPGPPPDDLGKNYLGDVEDREVSSKRMRDIVEEIQDKTFGNKQYHYKIFKEYDHDNDGYVSYNDIKEHLNKLKVNVNDYELKKFISLVDPQKKGYLDFNSFTSVITKTMVDKLTPLENTQENFLYHRKRQNMTPNSMKVEENIEYHKSFLDKFNTITKAQFIPDSDTTTGICTSFTLIGNQPATRFGAVPEWKNTFAVYQPPKTSGMYISEHDRFRRSDSMNSRIAFQKEEQEMRNTTYRAKLSTIQERQQASTERIKNLEAKKEMDDRNKVQTLYNRKQLYQAVID
jgi:Ca2+-binding EF-hand superfamily protein